MALGSSAYPDFCMAGRRMDALLCQLGAEQMCVAKLGDELDAQAQSVAEWQVGDGK